MHYIVYITYIYAGLQTGNREQATCIYAGLQMPNQEQATSYSLIKEGEELHISSGQNLPFQNSPGFAPTQQEAATSEMPSSTSLYENGMEGLTVRTVTKRTNCPGMTQSIMIANML